MVKNSNENLGAVRLTSNRMDIMVKEITREKKKDLLNDKTTTQAGNHRFINT